MKYLILKKRTIALTLSFIIITILILATLSYEGSYAIYYGKPLKKIPIYRVAREDKVVALSFDATYGSDKTEKIMEILKNFECDATFFLVGFWMDNNPVITKKIHDNGFEIGTHSNVHAHMSKLSYEQCINDLRVSMEKIEKYTGTKPTLFRAPFGEYNNTLLDAANELGLKTIQWDVDSLDWMNKTTEQIYTRVLGKAKEGSIILFHNAAEHILDVLPIVLTRLKTKGYKCIKLSELIYNENYLIDNNGEQKKILN